MNKHVRFLDPTKMAKRMSIFLLSILLLASYQAHSAQQVAVNSGLGGTGFITEDPTSGFGGTGRASSGFGGTGVIGTITEFGSIWVNGIEIGYGDKTDVTTDLNPQMTAQATANEVLKLGQQVILETLPNDEKALTKAIHLYYPLAGKITQVTTNGVVINDQYRVQTNKKTHYDATLKLQIGAFVAVNGYQTDTGEWQATRISHNPQNQGFYQPTPSKAFSNAVKQVIIETSQQQIKQWKTLAKLNAHNVQATPRMVVQGQWQNGQIQTIQIKPYTDFVNTLLQSHAMSESALNQRDSNDETQKANHLMQKEQVEMMQMQREQKSMVQDQLDQVQQIQELKEQFNQMRSLQN